MLRTGSRTDTQESEMKEIDWPLPFKGVLCSWGRGGEQMEDDESYSMGLGVRRRKIILIWTKLTFSFSFGVPMVYPRGFWHLHHIFEKCLLNICFSHGHPGIIYYIIWKPGCRTTFLHHEKVAISISRENVSKLYISIGFLALEIGKPCSRREGGKPWESERMENTAHWIN